MAELTTTTETTASSCCVPEAQATCCEPSAKAECCDPSHGDDCECSAGRGADSEVGDSIALLLAADDVGRRPVRGLLNRRLRVAGGDDARDQAE
jgi:hypothetical protein